MTDITGRVFIDINDIGRVASESGATLNMGGVNRTAVLSDNGVEGFREEPVAPSIECSIIHKANTSLSTFRDITKSSVFFETDSGKLYVMQESWLSEPPSLSDGKVSLTFEGKRIDEVQ